jgi:Gas vesicle synthesis protein GvpL/GvpF
MLLLYCMTEPNANVNAPATGVRGGAVTSVVEPGDAGSSLKCFYSDSDLSNTAQHTNQIAVDAMEFDSVIRGIFKEVAVIPFRFMTALNSVDEVRSFLRKNGDEYAEELGKIRDKIQMEVRITAKPAPRVLGESSGTDFLKSKQADSQVSEEVADRIIAACPGAKWKRKSAHDGLRLYALVDREAGSAGADKFTEAVKKVNAGPEFNLRSSGPWPATEFINCYADLQASIASAAKK